ncbi:MAG: hydroxyacylglutathione hydrolase [Stellaceae bacterium]
MRELDIRQIPVLRDNYVYLVHDAETGATGVVDPSVAAPVMTALEAAGWRLSHILNTHHHGDHTGGNLELKAKTGAIIVGPRADRDRIPGIDVAVGDGDVYRFGGHDAQIFDVPGHTSGHIAYWLPDSRALFCGDTLFIMGCGRLFEGTAAEMWNSLGKFKALPPETRVFCAHEYTQNNARFALTVEPGNPDLRARARRVDELRAQGQPTVPGTIGEELLTNPFLRADRQSLQESVGTVGDPIATLAAIRHRKDAF